MLGVLWSPEWMIPSLWRHCASDHILFTWIHSRYNPHHSRHIATVKLSFCFVSDILYYFYQQYVRDRRLWQLLLHKVPQKLNLIKSCFYYISITAVFCSFVPQNVCITLLRFFDIHKRHVCNHCQSHLPFYITHKTLLMEVCDITTCLKQQSSLLKQNAENFFFLFHHPENVIVGVPVAITSLTGFISETKKEEDTKDNNLFRY